jgi:hypothetical protein
MTTSTFKARAYYSPNGATTVFAIPFPYLLAAHVHVYVAGVETTAFTFPTPSQIQFTTAPATFTSSVCIKRITPDDAMLHTIQIGSIKPADINVDDLQLLYLTQEREDEAFYVSDRALKFPFPEVANEFAVSATRAGKVVVFDNAGQPTVSTQTIAEIEAGSVAVAGTVANKSALKTLPLVAGMVGATLSMLCHTTLGDGGEGFFRITQTATHAADDGVVVASNTAGFYLIRLGAGTTAKPEWWGVTGVAAADLAALTAASNYLGYYIGGGTLELGAKIYKAGGFVQRYDGLRVRTAGYRTIIEATANDQYIVKLCASDCVFEPFETHALSFTNVTHLGIVPEDETQTTTRTSVTNNDVTIKTIGGKRGVVLRCGPTVGGGDSNCYWNKIRAFTQNTQWSVFLLDASGGGASGANANEIWLTQVNYGGAGPCEYGLYIASSCTENNIYGLSLNGIVDGAAIGVYINGQHNRIFGSRTEVCTKALVLGANGTGCMFFGVDFLTVDFSAGAQPAYMCGADASQQPAVDPHGLFIQNSQIGGFVNGVRHEIYGLYCWSAAGTALTQKINASGIHNIGKSFVNGPGAASANFDFAVSYDTQAMYTVVAQGYDSGTTPTTIFSSTKFDVQETASGTFNVIGTPVTNSGGAPTTFTVTVTRTSPYNIRIAVNFVKVGVVQGRVQASLQGLLGGIQ